MENLYYKLAGVLAINTATAGGLATLIIAAFKAGTLTLRGAAALIAGTGIIGVIGATLALGAWFILRKKINEGHAALTAW